MKKDDVNQKGDLNEKEKEFLTTPHLKSYTTF